MAAFSNYLIVDKNGTGNHTTIGAAITAAVAGGAAIGSPWLIHIGLGSFSESPVVPAGVHLVGWGFRKTLINGSAEVHSGASLASCTVSNTSDLANATYGVRLVQDNNAERIILHNVDVLCYGDRNGVVAALQVEGAATNIYSRATGCVFYAKNSYNSTGTAAKTVGVRVMSDFAGWMEIFGGSHFKTSSQQGKAQGILVLNECVGGAGIYGYAHIVGDWEDVYAGMSPTPAGLILSSVNTTHPGALLDVGVAPGILPDPPEVVMAYTGNIPPLYSRTIHSMRYNGEMYKEYQGADYSISPVLVSDTAPTGSAPDGTVTLVTMGA